MWGSINGGQVFVGDTLNVNGGAFSSFTTVSGTFTLGTGNLLPLNSSNTVVNNGDIALSIGSASLSVGSSRACGNYFFVGGNATYDEVINSATAFGSLFAPIISLDGTLDITLANSYIPWWAKLYDHDFSPQPIPATQQPRQVR